MADGWLEPRTRIPFVGIIAMVIIVAVVAVFIKTQLSPLIFPEAEITVEDGNALTGRATSETFYGMREVELDRKELLRGSLQGRQGALTFTIDVPNQLLLLSNGERIEEIELQPAEGRLHATFSYNDVTAMLVADPADRSLSYSTESTMPMTLRLSEHITYLGQFIYKGDEYAVEFTPAAGQLLIAGKNIPLSNDGKFFSGTWMNGRVNKPVRIDTEKALLTIEDIY